MIDWETLKDINFSDDTVRIMDRRLSDNISATRNHLISRTLSGDVKSLNFLHQIIKSETYPPEENIKLLYSTASLGHWESILDIVNVFLKEPDSYFSTIERLNSKLVIDIAANSLIYHSTQTRFYVAWCCAFAIGYSSSDTAHAATVCGSDNNNSSKYNTETDLFYSFLMLANSKDEEYYDKLKAFISFPENIVNFNYFAPLLKIRINALHKTLLEIIKGTSKLASNVELVYLEKRHEADTENLFKFLSRRNNNPDSPPKNDYFLTLIRAFEVSKKLRANKNAGKISLYKAHSKTENNSPKTIFDLFNHKLTRKGYIEKTAR